MKTFSLGCTVAVSAYTLVEAETLEQAIKIASMRDVVISLDYDGADEGVEWLITEADGSPAEIHED